MDEMNNLYTQYDDVDLNREIQEAFHDNNIEETLIEMEKKNVEDIVSSACYQIEKNESIDEDTLMQYMRITGLTTSQAFNKLITEKRKRDEEVKSKKKKGKEIEKEEEEEDNSRIKRQKNHEDKRQDDINVLKRKIADLEKSLKKEVKKEESFDQHVKKNIEYIVIDSDNEDEKKTNPIYSDLIDNWILKQEENISVNVFGRKKVKKEIDPIPNTKDYENGRFVSSAFDYAVGLNNSMIKNKTDMERIRKKMKEKSTEIISLTSSERSGGKEEKMKQVTKLREQYSKLLKQYQEKVTLQESLLDEKRKFEEQNKFEKK